MCETNNVVVQNSVSFSDISPMKFIVQEQYKCAKSTAGQTVSGLSGLIKNLASNKQPSNEYQLVLYPKIIELGTELTNKYMETFVNNITEPLCLQVFGANLNGSGNDGKLNRLILCKNVDDRLRYKYIQFGQILSLLYDRLLFISRRDTSKIMRYVNNENERKEFLILQEKCGDFCKYLRGEDSSLMNRWFSFINVTRQNLGFEFHRKETLRGSVV
jgi:hypothetical protein